jgi:hypothetical protein
MRGAVAGLSSAGYGNTAHYILEEIMKRYSRRGRQEGGRELRFLIVGVFLL